MVDPTHSWVVNNANALWAESGEDVVDYARPLVMYSPDDNLVVMNHEFAFKATVGSDNFNIGLLQVVAWWFWSSGPVNAEGEASLTFVYICLYHKKARRRTFVPNDKKRMP